MSSQQAGWGPTADDLTREALAAAAGVDLVQDDAALEHIRNLFSRRGRADAGAERAAGPIPAWQPGRAESARHGARHRYGRAAHLLARLAGYLHCLACRQKCSPCGTQPLAPAIAAALPSPRVIRHRRIKCFGVGESDVEAMLPDMIRRKREPLVGITVSGATITLRITASGPNETACLRQMEPTVAQIREMLGVLVFGEEDDELEHAVLRLLDERSQSLAVAEWATDGLVSQWLAEAAADSEHFRGGDRGARREILASRCWSRHVNRARRRMPETAEAMARAVREKTGADFGLSVAAFPSDWPSSHGNRGPARMRRKHWHVASGAGQRRACSREGLSASQPSGDHEDRAAKQALNMLRSPC